MRKLSYALVAMLACGGAASAQNLSIATGGTGGTYYPYGGGLAELIGKYIDGAQATAEVTGASVENMALIAQQQSDLAIALAAIFWRLSRRLDIGWNATPTCASQ